MSIFIISALDKKTNVIGINNSLPWKIIPKDMKYFKEKTLYNTIIMGKKTFLSIGKPLIKRRNIIVSRNLEYLYKIKKKFNNIEVSNNLIRTLKYEKSINNNVFIIGGGNIYEQSIKYADILYLTFVHSNIAIKKNHITFPTISAKEWKIISSKKCDVSKDNIYPLTFVTLKRL